MDKNQIKEAALKFKNNDTSNLQFLQKDSINCEGIDKQDFSHINGHTPTLYDNMVKLGLDEEIVILEKHKYHFAQNGLTRSQTHHVIPKEIWYMLQKFKIKGVDDGRNGIILPSCDTEYCFANGSIHNGNHSNNYTEMICKMLETCSTEDDVWTNVDEIKTKLYNGEIKLN